MAIKNPRVKKEAVFLRSLTLSPVELAQEIAEHIKTRNNVTPYELDELFAAARIPIANTPIHKKLLEIHLYRDKRRFEGTRREWEASMARYLDLFIPNGYGYDKDVDFSALSRFISELETMRRIRYMHDAVFYELIEPYLDLLHRRYQDGIANFEVRKKQDRERGERESYWSIQGDMSRVHTFLKPLLEYKALADRAKTHREKEMKAMRDKAHKDKSVNVKFKQNKRALKGRE